MQITEVRVKLVERPSERLRAFCSITLDGDFVIRDLKIIGGTNGAFVAMPSRKLADRCSRCGCKNHLRARYCNECGQKLNENRAPKDAHGRAKLHADVAHPINAACRERIQAAVIKAYEDEVERAKSPGYKPAKYDEFDDDLTEEAEPVEAAPVPADDKADTGDNLGDYNSLIADLKRDAANRQQKRREQQSAGKDSAEIWGEGPPDHRPPQRQQTPARPEPASRDDRAGDRASQPQAPPEQSRSEDLSRSDDVTTGALEPPAAADVPSSPAPGPAPPPAKEDDKEADGFGAGLF